MQHRAFYNMKQGSITLMIAIFGGLLFKLVHIPVPWLLGPMVTMVIVTNTMKRQFVWHVSIRNIGMMMIGYVIGLSMTASALKDMVKQLPSMVLMTLLLLLLSAGIAYVISKVSNQDYNTSLLASMPGGLTQIIILAEETEGINLAIVTVTQVMRLMLIVIAMPLLVLLPIFGSGSDGVSTTLQTEPSVSLFPNIIVFAVVGIVLTVIGVKIKFPTAHLLAPMLGTMVLQVSGVEGPELPGLLTNIAQLMIGTHIGLMLNANQLPGKARTISLAFISGIMLVFGSVLLSFLLTKLHPISSATGLLSMAPGGMDQMSIIAHAIGADLSTVSGYQVFRTLVIFFALPPFIKWFFSYTEKRKQKKYNVQRRQIERERQGEEVWTHK